MAFLAGLGRAMTALGQDLSATKREDEERQRLEEEIEAERERRNQLGEDLAGVSSGMMPPGHPGYKDLAGRAMEEGVNIESYLPEPDKFSQPIRTNAGWGQVGPGGALRMIEGADLPTSESRPVNLQRMPVVPGEPNLAWDPRTNTTARIPGPGPDGEPLIAPEPSHGPNYNEATNQIRQYYAEFDDQGDFLKYRISERDIARLAPLMMKGEWFPGDPKPSFDDGIHGSLRTPGPSGSLMPPPAVQSSEGEPVVPDPVDINALFDTSENTRRARDTAALLERQQQWDDAMAAGLARGMSREEAEGQLGPRPTG